MPFLPIQGDAELNEDGTDISLIEGVQAIRQQIEAGAQVFAGSWVYDTKAGVDWVNLVLTKGADYRVARAAFWEFLLSIPGVSRVEKVDLAFEKDTRTLTITFSAFALGGEPINGSVSF